MAVFSFSLGVIGAGTAGRTFTKSLGSGGSTRALIGATLGGKNNFEAGMFTENRWMGGVQAAAGGLLAAKSIKGIFDAMASMISDVRPLQAELARTAKLIDRRLVASVPDRDLSGDGRRGLRVEMGKQRGQGGLNKAGWSGGIYASGPWQLIEWDTKPHVISARNGKALKLANGATARKVNHPGTTGKHIWENASADADSRMIRAAGSIIGNAIGLKVGVSTAYTGAQFAFGTGDTLISTIATGFGFQSKPFLNFSSITI